MRKQRASCWIAVCSLLALIPISASPAPRSGNPCKQMQHTLDRRIDDLKTQQKDELLQCEQSNGRGSGACLSLKDQQKHTLREMRDGRTGQMNDCYGRPSFTASTLHATQGQNQNYYDQTNNQYADNDQNPHKVADPHPRHPRHPHHPSSANGEKSGSSDKPSKGGEHSGAKTSHANAGAGGSGSGGATSSASHNHKGGGGGSSGGGSYSGSSHSSGVGGGSYSGGSSGSSHSSGGGGGSYSGGSSSSGSASSSSSSPSASGGRPK